MLHTDPPSSAISLPESVTAYVYKDKTEKKANRNEMAYPDKYTDFRDTLRGNFIRNLIEVLR